MYPTGFIVASPHPTYHLLVHNENASMWMRNLWNNHIEDLWNSYFCQQIRGQTFWLFHLKTNNLDINHNTTLKLSPFVSIPSMRFVFPFCPIEHGFIVIPISKNTWESEATYFSDFSSFLPLRVQSGVSSRMQNFFSIKFTLRELLQNYNSSIFDRGLPELIFPNVTLIKRSDKTCFCCKLNPV